jgi:hypothetical protein
LEEDGYTEDIPEKWGIRLPMDTMDEVAAFAKKMCWGPTVDSSGKEAVCRIEMVLF